MFLLNKNKSLIYLIISSACFLGSAKAEEQRSFLTNILSSRAGDKAVEENEGKNIEKFLTKEQCPKHYTWGEPKIKDDAVNKRSLYLCRLNYAIQYDSKLKVPLWSSEQLYKSNFEIPYFKNDLKLTPDEELPSKMQALPEEYLNNKYFPIQLVSLKNSIINRENFTAEELRNVNLAVIKESKQFSNTVPMVYNNLANTIWSELENMVVELIKKNNRLYVTTGVIYLNGKYEYKFPKSEMLVPTHFYKVIINPDTHGSVSYIIPNKEILTKKTTKINEPKNLYLCNNQECSLSDFIVHMKEVERLAGIEFFPQLSPNWAAQIKMNRGELHKEEEKKKQRIKELENISKK